MKIGIDVSQIIYGTGVSVYTKNLVENLLKLDNKNEYILFGGSLRRRGDLISILNKIKGKRVEKKTFLIPPTMADLLWNRLHTLRIEKLAGNMDIYHSSDWAQAPSNAFKVTTIHDLVPIKYPILSQPKIVATHKGRFKWIKKEADIVIVPSQATANDIEGLGIKPERIKVIPEAVDSSFKPAKKTEIEEMKRKLRISGKYLLSVGVNERKNTQRIVEAYEKVGGEVNIKLIIVGNPHVKLYQPRGVRFLGHVSSDVMATLYSGAEVLVYPSLYEGFGLPILEAFACKIPVVTTNFGSMVEVAGKAAVLVDPYDTRSIANGILEALKKKEKLIKLGISQLKIYSWEKTAKETLKVYNEISHS